MQFSRVDLRNTGSKKRAVWNNHPVGDFVWFDENIVVVDDSMGGAHHIDPVFEYWENLGLDLKSRICRSIWNQLSMANI